MGVEARVAGAVSVRLLPPAGQRDEIDLPSPRLLAKVACHVVSVRLRHADIEQRHLRRRSCGGLDGGFAVVRDMDLVTGDLEQQGEALRRIGVVVGDEHPQRSGDRFGVLWGDVADRRRCDDGQLEHELAAVADARAARLDRSAVQLDELAHEREADPEAVLAIERPVDAREEIEDLGELLGRNADAVVFHGHPEHVVRRADRHLDSAARRRVLGRIADQVGEDLHEPLAVRLQLDRGGRHADLQAMSLGVDVIAADVDRGLDDLLAADALAPQFQHAARCATRRAGRREARHLRDLTLDHVDALQIGLGRGLELEIAGGIADRSERVAQLVGEDCDELVLASVVFVALELRPFAIGDVARDLRSADDPSRCVAHRRDGERNVHQAAVFARQRLEVLDALAAAQPRQDVALFAEAVGRNDQLMPRPTASAAL